MRLKALCLSLSLAPALMCAPQVDRVVPLGAMRGSTVEVELIGSYLSNAASVWFDSEDLRWLETLEATSGRLRGKVRVARDAALGPHIINVRGKDGRSNSRLFNVTQFPSVMETEPNDTSARPQPVELRSQVIHGYLDRSADIDVYSFTAREGERWTFDLRSLEYGGYLECEMALLDGNGAQVAFNDDRDDYLETPFLEHVFTKSGAYRVKIDQYRGPQGVACSANCGYMLQVSQLPVIEAAFPLGARTGRTTRVRVTGRALGAAESLYLTPVRSGEYYRLTFPHSIPVHARPDPPRESRPVIQGKITRRAPEGIEADFAVPADAPPGLWRLWVADPNGTADGISLEITSCPEFDEKDAAAADWRDGEIVVNGSLDRDKEEDVYLIRGQAGKPLYAWTLSTQLGLPYLDTVLELFDESGKLVAEHDDLSSGQGTVIGNPDSSLFYTPKTDQTLRLVVRDRIGRGGSSYVYRLHLKPAEPGFQLLTDPEEFNIQSGGHAELTALLVREPGFGGAVDVWVEGLPAGAEATRGRFRSDQYFGPSDDGDNVIIPQAPMKITLPASVATGEYPIRVLGRAASGGPVVEALTTLWIGPPGKRNDVRRPLPLTTLTVFDAAPARLSLDQRAVELAAGGATKITVGTAEDLPLNAGIRVTGLPAGVRHKSTERGAGKFIVHLDADASARPASTPISIEANHNGRWIMTEPVSLTVSDSKPTSSGAAR